MYNPLHIQILNRFANVYKCDFNSRRRNNSWNMPKEGHDFKELGGEFEKIRSELQIVKGFSGKLFMCVCVCVLKKKNCSFILMPLQPPLPARQMFLLLFHSN